MLVEATEGLLLIDCGSDARHSLAKQGLTALDITNVYISHLHADHIGGLEWLGIVSYFARTRNDPSLKPRLHIRRTLMEDLWQSLHGGMGTIEGHVANLSTYFDVRPIERNGSFEFADTLFQTVQVVHYYDGYEIVPTYALLFECNGCLYLRSLELVLRRERVMNPFLPSSTKALLTTTAKSLRGSTIPFAATREEREASGDSRLSIEERYASREAYLELVKQASEKLIEQRFLLEEDLENMLGQAGQHYDLFASRVAQTQPVGD